MVRENVDQVLIDTRRDQREDIWIGLQEGAPQGQGPEAHHIEEEEEMIETHGIPELSSLVIQGMIGPKLRMLFLKT